jgi:hypothetical protein
MKRTAEESTEIVAIDDAVERPTGAPSLHGSLKRGSGVTIFSYVMREM